MKKVLIIGLIVALVLIIVGGAGEVYARVRGIDNTVEVIKNTTQNGDNDIQQFGYGPGGNTNEYGNGYGPGGMMRGQGDGYGRGGMMGGRGNGYGPGMMGNRGFGVARGEGILHDYMISAFADAIGLTVDEVNTRLAGGETLKEIAIAQGTAENKLSDLATQVRKAALDQAVAAGVITQAQADQMLERMNNIPGLGFGLDNCPMWDNDNNESQQP
jgi:hypothetical protein